MTHTPGEVEDMETETVQAYKTKDGTLFESPVLAREHEARCSAQNDLVAKYGDILARKFRDLYQEKLDRLRDFGQWKNDFEREANAMQMAREGAVSQCEHWLDNVFDDLLENYCLLEVPWHLGGKPTPSRPLKPALGAIRLVPAKLRHVSQQYCSAGDMDDVPHFRECLSIY